MLIQNNKDTSEPLAKQKGKKKRRQMKKKSKKGITTKYRSKSGRPTHTNANIKTDVFDPTKYGDLKDLKHTISMELKGSDIIKPNKEGLKKFEEMQKWFNNQAYQRENHKEACSKLGIPNTQHPRLRSMIRSLVFKFWQPVAIMQLLEIKAKDYLQGAILADSVGLRKTWECIRFLLKVSKRHLYR
jgi:SNF2 family DNA or RNA helicase